MVIDIWFMMVWYVLYDGLLFALCWFSMHFMVIDICFMTVWYMHYDGFDICLMMFWYMLYDVSICLIYFWYVIWHMLWYIYFDNVVMCTPVYGCKYCNELCYKASLCGMGVMSLWLCYHVIMISCGYVIMMLWCYMGWNLVG